MKRVFAAFCLSLLAGSLLMGCSGFALNSFLRYIKECTANKREEL